MKNRIESICDEVSDMPSLQEGIYPCGPGVRDVVKCGAEALNVSVHQ